MLAIDTPVFLLVPDSSKKRVLHPGKIIKSDGSRAVAQFDDGLTVAEGTEVVVFTLISSKFMQQGAIVVAQDEGATPGGLALKLVGEAASAEQRQIFRVSVAVANIKARIGNEANCHVVDISSEGCAAITGQEYKIGSTVRINFIHEGETVLANARVQTMKKVGDGRYRYGFFIGDKISPARRALAAISAAVQRQQLKRLAAA